MHILCFPENERITPILLWDGCYWFTEYGRCEGRWEGVELASGEGRPGSLVYRQIKSLHCSGYLLVSTI